MSNQMQRLGNTDLDVFPLCLGSNVFLWTANDQESAAVLDRYVAAGGNFIDTSDNYSAWVDGHTGGEAEDVIGRWHVSRGNRDQLVLASKVGAKPDRPGLSAPNVRVAAEESLRRLRTDRIDIYYAHVEDPDVPLEETLGVLSELVSEGKVLHLAASNYSASSLTEALALSRHNGWPGYAVLQPEYNFMIRDYERDVRAVCERNGVACVPHSALAQGFLTGKYRPASDSSESPRADLARSYFDRGGAAALTALDEVAAEHQVGVAAVALSWLAARPTVASVIASARTPDQLDDLLAFAPLRLSADEYALLDGAVPSTV